MELFNYSSFIKKVVERAYLDITKEHGLTNNEIAVISYLAAGDGDTASDIVNDLLFSKSHVSLSVDSLVKRGMIEKVQDAQDKKIYHLLLTEKAVPVTEGLSRRKQEIEKIFFRGLTEKEKEQFQRMAEKIVANATESSLLK